MTGGAAGPTRFSKGIYLWTLGKVLNCRVAFPAWALVVRILKGKPWASATGSDRLHATVAEAYQIVWLLLLAVALSLMPSYRMTAWWLVPAVLASYRAWEIIVVTLKWLLVDQDPIISYRRSLISLLINLVEVSIAYTILGRRLSRGTYADLWSEVMSSLGGAFTLERPNLTPPWDTLFAIEAAILVVFLLACVVGGIQRKVLGKDGLPKP